MNIQEQTLEHLIQCPLMVTEISKEDNCAHNLTAWVLRQSFEDKLQGRPQDILHNIRGKVLELWGADMHHPVKTLNVNTSLGTLARTAAFRLLNLVLDYEVVHLEQPYNLILSGYTIQGRYAMLRKRKGECLPYILVLHSAEPSIRKEHALPPDVTSLARYLHAHTNAGHTDSQILHYPVFKGKAWFNKTINIPLATRYLNGILKLADTHSKYPSMGDHCTKCTTKPCLEVFTEINNNYG